MNPQQHEVRAKKAKMAIRYITLGTLMVVWAAVWLVYLLVPTDVSGAVYVASAVVLSGIAVVIIGVSVGEIGRGANKDEDEAEAATSRENQPVVGPHAHPRVLKPAHTEEVELETTEPVARK